MEYERVPGPTGQIELWAYQWDLTSRPPVKTNRVRIGVEQPPRRRHLLTSQVPLSLGHTAERSATLRRPTRTQSGRFRPLPGRTSPSVVRSFPQAGFETASLAIGAARTKSTGAYAPT